MRGSALWVTGHKKENVKIHSYPGNSSLVKQAAAVGSALKHVPPLCCCSGSLQLRDDLQTWEGFWTLHIPEFSGTIKIQTSELSPSRSTRERHSNYSQLKNTFLLQRMCLSIFQIQFSCSINFSLYQTPPPLRRAPRSCLKTTSVKSVKCLLSWLHLNLFNQNKSYQRAT